MSRILTLTIICALVLIGSTPIFADQIFLKNGDRLTGKILKKDGDKIVIETESAGVVTVLWASVEKISADQNLNIKLADGQLIKGTVAQKDGDLEITTKDAGTVTVEKQKVEAVRNDAEQLKFEEERDRLLNPGFGDLWTGSADVGFSLTSGNSETRAFTAGARAARETTRDKISVYANAIKASNSTTGISVTTADAIWFGGRYDYNVSPKVFVFGSADFEHDSPQLLDLRSVFGGGVGYRAIRSERTSLDLFGGASYNMEYFDTGLNRKSVEIMVGDELTFKINPRMRLTQRLAVYPNVSDPGRFRALLDASLLGDINSWLGWHVTLGDRFNSAPVGGAEKNDMLLSTGLRVNFGRAKK
ncbi:MAG: YdiY family protein [Pyrinomonadaceae bacterium]